MTTEHEALPVWYNNIVHYNSDNLSPNTHKSHSQMSYEVSFVSSKFHSIIILYIDGLMQERHNSIANALELCLSCIGPSILYCIIWRCVIRVTSIRTLSAFPKLLTNITSELTYGASYGVSFVSFRVQPIYSYCIYQCCVIWNDVMMVTKGTFHIDTSLLLLGSITMGYTIMMSAQLMGDIFSMLAVWYAKAFYDHYIGLI